MSTKDPEIPKLRRFALVISIILFTYSIAGVELETSEVIRPMGIPFKIARPDLLGIGLVLASIYSSLRYWYYAMLVRKSPFKARTMLEAGNIPGDRKGMPTNDLINLAKDAVQRYYPTLFGNEINHEVKGTGKSPGFVMGPIPFSTRLLTATENIDYTAPIWANVIAIATYVLRSI